MKEGIPENLNGQNGHESKNSVAQICIGIEGQTARMKKELEMLETKGLKRYRVEELKEKLAKFEQIYDQLKLQLLNNPPTKNVG